MAWSDSRVFRAFVYDVMTQTAAFDLNSHTIKAALFNDTITPNNNSASASTAYNTGVWLTGAEQISSTQWPAGGVSIGSPAMSQSVADTVYFFGNNPASSAGATLSNVYGTLVYDDTLTTPVANQGVCFNYLGGNNSVTNGVLTIVWNSSGIFRVSL